MQKNEKIELDQLKKSGHLERPETIEEDCFVSPVVNTVKKDKMVKIALDARKLNENCVKKRPHMQTWKNYSNQIPAEISRNDHDPIWISVMDLDFAYGQRKLAPETSKHCYFTLNGENMNSYYRFLKGFYGPADIPIIFQQKIDRTLGHQKPVWLDNIIIVTRGTEDQCTPKLHSVLSKLDKEGYRASNINQNSTKKDNMAPTHNITRRHQTKKNKNRRNELNGTPTNAKSQKTFPRCHTILLRIHTQPFREHRQHETTNEDRIEMGLDKGPKYGFQKSKTRAHKTTLSSTLKRKQRKHRHY